MSPIKLRFSSEAQRERMEVYGYAMGFRTVQDFLLHAAENYITRNALGAAKEDLGKKIYGEVRGRRSALQQTPTEGNPEGEDSPPAPFDMGKFVSAVKKLPQEKADAARKRMGSALTDGDRLAVLETINQWLGSKDDSDQEAPR